LSTKSGGGILRGEARDRTFEDLWLSNLHPRASGEEDEAGAFRKKGILVGYIETSKAYRIFIPMQRKIVVSRDVKFEKNLTSRSTQESSTMTEDKEQ
jgi:hypothetical protein